MATGKKGGMTCTYVVGRYRPAGNMGGEYKEKVPKGSYSRSVCSSLDKMVKEIESSAGGASAAASSSANTFDGSTSEPEGLPFSRPGNEADQNEFTTGDGAKPDQGGEPPGGGTVPGGGATGAANQQGALLLHNKFRKIHGTPSMKLNSKMSEEAQAYAQVLLKKGRRNLRHSDSKDGENLAFDCNPNFSAAEATKRW